MADTEGLEGSNLSHDRPDDEADPTALNELNALNALNEADASPPASASGALADARFPIVGLGASAGGLGALEQFFAQMPADSGLAFVVVTHQHPTQTSLMAELLGRKTRMPVVQVASPTPVAPDHVYTVRPGYNIAILDGVLQPMEADVRTTHLPIDYFFRSLARDQKERAIGIVLSGTGTDGSLGLTAIKGELGMVMVQDEKSAQYGGMPHSAIATAIVDYVLPAAEMPGQLLAYAALMSPGHRPLAADEQPPPAALQQIFVLIRDRTGHDFSHYKSSTIGRRIERRMNIHNLGTLKRYVRYLQTNAEEIDLLFRELLIGVTSFFRDPEAWEALAGPLAALAAAKADHQVLRVWVPGCSTGEEAYALAILLRESIDALARPIGVQVFATDLDAAAIEVARTGSYPRGIANDVSPERLTRFFVADNDTYRVKKEIRDMLVFAPQNLIGDPPFTKLDLLSCRNLLIYLDGTLQRRLLPIFHYALRPAGLLFLGSSESLGASTELFAALDKKWKIFQRREVPAGTYQAEFPASLPERPEAGVPTLRPGTRDRASASATANLDRMTERMLLRELVPATVLVHERGDVVYVHGRTGRFLEPSPGSQASANIFNMARHGLQIGLAAAIRQATATGEEVVQRGNQVKSNGGVITVDLRVMRLREPESLQGLLRVTFTEGPPVSPAQGGESGTTEGADRLAELEGVLQYTRDSHQSTTEELETANEELQSTNEELQSTNEELQSANEELETSKEEMQSLNEELQTVNAELQEKVDQLSHANNDMKNLLNGTDIATLFLDNELRINRYTEPAKRVIRLIPSDIGRPIGDLVSTVHYDRLVADAQEVLRTLARKEIEVEGEDGAYYLMRVLPYRTTDNVIEGLVLTFVDVTKVKALREEQRRLVDVLQGSAVSVFGQDRELRFTWACNWVFGKSPLELIGKTDRELFAPAEAERLAAIKNEALAGGTVKRHRIELTVSGGARTFDLSIEPSRDLTGRVTGLSCIAMDVTPLA